METGQIVIVIIQTLMGIVIGLIGFIINATLKRLEVLEVDMKNMKSNYLKKFEEVVENQHRVKEELIRHNIVIKDEAARQFSEIKVAIAEVTVLVKNQAEFCRYIQKQKEY